MRSSVLIVMGLETVQDPGVEYAAGLKLGESAEFATEQDTQKSDLLPTK